MIIGNLKVIYTKENITITLELKEIEKKKNVNKKTINAIKNYIKKNIKKFNSEKDNRKDNDIDIDNNYRYITGNIYYDEKKAMNLYFLKQVLY